MHRLGARLGECLERQTRRRSPARKAERPGGAAAEAAAPPGATPMGDHPPLVDLSALASTRPTSPVVPEGMAGDAALSARLRVAPLRSRHEGIRPTRSGRIRIDCDGPLVKILNSGGAPLPKPGCNPPPFKTLADKVGHRRTGGSPHQLRHRRLDPRQAGSPVGDDWVVVVPCTDSADASWNGAVLRPMPEGT